jgi:hypothetical protein
MSGLFLCPFLQIYGAEEAWNNKLMLFWAFSLPKNRGKDGEDKV